MESVRTLVIDPGSFSWKVGFSDCTTPSVVNTIVSRDAATNETVVGDYNLEGNANYKHFYPVESSIFTNWNEIETLLNHVFNEELKIDPAELRMLFADSPVCGPKANREKLTEIMFEQYHVKEYSLLPHPTLSAIACNTSTAMVFNCGESVNYAIPIYEGIPLYHAFTANYTAGRDLTNYLSRLISTKLNVTFPRHIVRKLKEFTFLPSERTISNNEATQKVTIERTQIELDSECLWSPEILFDPRLVDPTSEDKGIANVLCESLAKCGEEKEFYSESIILTGGSTLVPGFVERLKNELQILMPGSNIKIQAPLERAFLSWAGGCKVASNPKFANVFVTPEDYEESGPSIYSRKCFLVVEEGNI